MFIVVLSFERFDGVVNIIINYNYIILRVVFRCGVGLNGI